MTDILKQGLKLTHTYLWVQLSLVWLLQPLLAFYDVDVLLLIMPKHADAEEFWNHLKVRLWGIK